MGSKLVMSTTPSTPSTLVCNNQGCFSKWWGHLSIDKKSRIPTPWQRIWCTYMLEPCFFSQWGITPRGSWRELHPRNKMFPWDLTPLPTHISIPCALERSAFVLQWSWCWPEPWWSQQISWQDLDFSSSSWGWTVWNSFLMSHSSSCASAWCLELCCSLQVFLCCVPTLQDTLQQMRESFKTSSYFGERNWWFSRG